MSSSRQVILGFCMSLLFSAIVLGSLSLSLVESGYRLGHVPATQPPEVVFSGIRILTMAGNEVESNAPVSVEEMTVLLEPTIELCPFPAGWIKISVGADKNDLKSLAHLYNSSVRSLMEGNCLMVEILPVNSELYVPNVPVPPTAVRPRPAIRPPVYIPPSYPPGQAWPTRVPVLPSSTPITPQPTQPPTLPPTLTSTVAPPTPLPTEQPPTPQPTPQPTVNNPPPTNPPPTYPPPTSPPPTEPPQPTPAPPTPLPQPTPQPLPTEPRLPPPPQPTPPEPIIPTQPVFPTYPPPGQPPASTSVVPGPIFTPSPF
jgi:hypothetical protein